MAATRSAAAALFAMMILVRIARSRQLQQDGGVQGAVPNGIPALATGGGGHRLPQHAAQAADDMPHDDGLDRVTHAFVSKLRHAMAERCRRPAAAQPGSEHPISAALRSNDLVDG
jgi:hypothetical protein